MSLRAWRARSLAVAVRRDTFEEPWRGWRLTRRADATPLGGWGWVLGAVLFAWTAVAVLRVTSP